VKNKLLASLNIILLITFIFSFRLNTTHSKNTHVFYSSLLNTQYSSILQNINIDFSNSESLELTRLKDKWIGIYKNQNQIFDFLPIEEKFIFNLLETFTKVMEITQLKENNNSSNLHFKTKIDFYTSEKLVTSLQFGDFDVLQKNIYCKNLLNNHVFLVPQDFYHYITNDTKEWFNGLFFYSLRAKTDSVQTIIIQDYVANTQKILTPNSPNFESYAYYLKSAQSKKIQSLNLIESLSPEYKIAIKTGRGELYSIFLFKKKVANQEIYYIKPESATYSLQVSHWTYEQLVTN